MQPTRAEGRAWPGERIAFTLDPLPPFRLDLTVWTLRRRPDNVVDRWDGTTYQRALVLAGAPVDVAVAQIGPADAPRLEVTATGQDLAPDTVAAVTAALQRMLGTRVDLAPFYRLAAADPTLGPLAERFRGMKPPRYPTLFEALANAIACQQITLTQGIRLLNRLTDAYGLAAPGPAGLAHAFPRPRDLGPVGPEALRDLGLSSQKARALAEVSEAAEAGRLDLEGLASLDDAAAIARLCELRGVGRWSAEYVLLRGLGRLSIFPGDDVGARKNLQRWLGLTEPLDYAEVRRLVARWEPFAGLLYFHLLLGRLAEAGYLAPNQGGSPGVSPELPSPGAGWRGTDAR